MNFSLAVHGGAGTIDPKLMTSEKRALYETGLKNALIEGEKILKAGGSSLDAVCAAVTELENFPLFNAGKGSVFNALHQHEMDASLMDGKTLDAGAIAAVKGIKNPILLAQKVLTHSEHVLLIGKGAEEFAALNNISKENDAYFFTAERYVQLLNAEQAGKTQMDHTVSKKGTVGAVAFDINGNLAAATSTGGMTYKKFGRVGDTPLIGAGTYANNQTCAVSCTGHGEFFIRAMVAFDIHALMAYKNMRLKDAAVEVVQNKLKEMGGEGGIIAVDKIGNIVMEFNSEGMYRGFITPNDMQIKIFANE